MLCHRCGTFFTAGSRFCPGCGLELSARVALPEVLSERGAAQSGPLYAGFWRRVWALLIDRILLAVVTVSMCLLYRLLAGIGDLRHDVLLLTLVSAIFGFLLRWLYCTLLESSSLQATLGKVAMGIVVTDEQGGRVSLARANGRYWSKIISSMTLGIGYLMAAFTSRKQALHDVIAATLVVRK
jgi:uncharacterized RDD family membrane protein YckC